MLNYYQDMEHFTTHTEALDWVDSQNIGPVSFIAAGIRVTYGHGLIDRAERWIARKMEGGR